MCENYLEKTKYVDYDKDNIQVLAKKLKDESKDEIDLVKRTFEYVRDNIHHSFDYQDRRITISASSVLKEGVGICWGKANLLAALLRANNIPSGFSYQRLALTDDENSSFCIHALNTVYLKSLDKWIRLDARGNKKGVNAIFSTSEEHLAFHVKRDDEIDYHDNNYYPSPNLMKALEKSSDMLDLYLHHLPDKLSY